MALQHLRSSTAHKRPIPTVMSAGQIAVNTNEASPGLFFKDSNGDLVKVGPVHIGPTAPNSSPASVAATALVTGTVYQILTVGTTDFTLVGAANNNVGTIFTATGTTTGTGTVSAQQGVEKGEQWLDTSLTPNELKVYNGAAWVSATGQEIPVSKLANGTAYQLLQTDSAGTGVEWTSNIDIPGTLNVTNATTLDSTLSVAGVATFSAGSAGAPSITLGTDSDTGIYSSDTAALSISTSSDKRVTFSDNENPTSTIFNMKIHGENAYQTHLTLTDDNDNAIVQLSNGIDGEYITLNTGGSGADDGFISVDSNGSIIIRGNDENNGGALRLRHINAASCLSFTGSRSGAAGWDAGRIDVFSGIGSTELSWMRLLLTDRPKTVNDKYIYLAEGVGETPDNTLFATAEDTDFFVGMGRYDTNIDSYRDSAPIFLGADGTMRSSGLYKADGRIELPAGGATIPALSYGADSTTGTGMYFPASGEIAFSTQGNGRMFINSDGEVGIGTSDPGALIQIGEGDTGGSTNVHSIARIEGRAVSGGQSVATLEFYQVTNASVQFVGASIGIESSAGTRSESELVFQVSQGANTHATEAMRLSHDGRLGVGTASPDGLLTVRPSSGNSQVFIRTNDTTSRSQLIFGDSADSNVGGIQYNHTDDSLQFHVGNVGEKARIDSSGNVGIGTTSPAANLHVKGATNTTFRIDNADDSTAEIMFANTGSTNMSIAVTDTNMIFSDTNNERMRIDSSGNVGVGTTSPSELLHLNGTNPFIYVEADSNTGNSGITFADGANKGQIMYDHDGDYMRFSTNGTANERMRIDSSGNVGVGTTSPVRNLQLGDNTSSAEIISLQTSTTGNGSIYFGDNTADSREYRGMLRYSHSDDAMQFWTSSTEQMRIDSSGRLLVGTSTARSNYDASSSSLTPRIQAEGTTSSTSSMGLVANNTAYRLFLCRAGGSDVGSNTAVSNGDMLGELKFNGADGANLIEAASISSKVDGTPGTNDMPGRLMFSTTADGASSPTERMRIDSAGNVGIGTTNPDHELHVEADTPTIQVESNGAYGSESRLLLRAKDSGGTARNMAQVGSFGTGSNSGILRFSARVGGNLTEVMRIADTGLVGIQTTAPTAALGIGNFDATRGIALQSGTTDAGYIYFADGNTGDALYRGYLQYEHVGDHLRIGTAAVEQMRIDGSGNVLAGKTTASLASVGHELRKASFAAHTVSGNPCLRVNRLASNGALVQFYQASNLEGSISVSGTTVSYNGAHLSRWSQLANGAERFEILRGSVLSNLDEMCEWSDEDNEQLNRMKVSDVEGDRNVSGVFQAWDDDDDTYTNDFYCAMTGDFVIRIAQGVTVERGDLLMSAGDGTAKPQDDDIIRSKTIAKVTSTVISETYSDGSYCVPCVLMAC